MKAIYRGKYGEAGVEALARAIDDSIEKEENVIFSVSYEDYAALVALLNNLRSPFRETVYDGGRS